MRSIILILLFVYTKCDDYRTRRASILELEAKITLGGNTTLTDKESIVNDCLMRHKFNEVDYGCDHPDQYKFSHHFFSYKDKIPDSKVYKIIKDMPKGAVLHLHDSAVLGPDYWLNITYMDNLYICYEERIKFLFADKMPNDTCEVQWQLVRDVRESARNVTKFDQELRKHLTMVVDDPDKVYSSQDKTWNLFRKYFATVYPLWSYIPVWQQAIYDVLTALKENNIMYTEMRTSLSNLYAANGTVYDKFLTAKLYRTTVKRFLRENPDFFGVKLIFAPGRKQDMGGIANTIQLTREVRKMVPELIVGFDLVGEEDLGRPLIDFVPLLSTVKDINFFFHAGETGWFGTSTDENLLDAVLLGTKRIGHAYALSKHPVIMKLVMEKDIGMEINVLSNEVLSLVRDLRNHPLSVYLSLGMPVVLASDDPGAWEADPLSYDFYVAFVGIASRLSDLRMLKTLALNSLKYSALDTLNKQKAIRTFDIKWNNFIDNFNCSSYQSIDFALR